MLPLFDEDRPLLRIFHIRGPEKESLTTPIAWSLPPTQSHLDLHAAANPFRELGETFSAAISASSMSSPVIS